MWNPRTCGEKSVLMLRLRLTVGSSPHMRGKEVAVLVQQGEDGITPAQAGRSPYFLYGKKDYKDHPRIGGEKAELTAAVISAMGSPPRRRGKGYREFGIDISDRITPAQAGKRPRNRCVLQRTWDHPRISGEKLAAAGVVGRGRGSPPRRRGKIAQRWRVLPEHGITPAQAGKRKLTEYFGVTAEDHPRIGGEKSRYWPIIMPIRGSPPRRRGKAGQDFCPEHRPGITPAWAGKS